MADVGGGAEFLDVADEEGGEVGLVEVLLEQGSVSGAEAGVWVRWADGKKRRPEAERCWQWSGEESVMVVDM